MVLYVGNLVFELPPVYEPQGAAFNGITAGRAMFDCLTAHLGVVQGDDGPMPLSARCRYMMVDGCGVNHCARKELSSILDKYLTENFAALGDEDYRNLRQSFRLKAHTMWLLTCIGHFIDNVAADAMKHWDGSVLFLIRKLFMHLFYGGKKVSAKKGRYRGADLDLALGKFHPEIETAAKDISTIIKENRPFRAAVQISDIKKFQTAQLLKAKLTVISQIAPVDSLPLLLLCENVSEEWGTREYDDFDKALGEKYGALQECMEGARSIKRQLSPKIGGGNALGRGQVRFH